MATERTLNIHKLPPCPLCSKNMVIGKSTKGPKIYCVDYAHCGGIIHNLHVVPESQNDTLPSPGSANFRRMQQYA